MKGLGGKGPAPAWVAALESVAADRSLSKNARGMLNAMVRWWNPGDGLLCPSQQDIADAAGLHRSTVNEVIHEELVPKGLVEIVPVSDAGRLAPYAASVRILRLRFPGVPCPYPGHEPKSGAVPVVPGDRSHDAGVVGDDTPCRRGRHKPGIEPERRENQNQKGSAAEADSLRDGDEERRKRIIDRVLALPKGTSKTGTNVSQALKYIRDYGCDAVEAALNQIEGGAGIREPGAALRSRLYEPEKWLSGGKPHSGKPKTWTQAGTATHPRTVGTW